MRLALHPHTHAQQQRNDGDPLLSLLPPPPPLLPLLLLPPLLLLVMHEVTATANDDMPSASCRFWPPESSPVRSIQHLHLADGNKTDRAHPISNGNSSSLLWLQVNKQTTNNTASFVFCRENYNRP
jgi:hypothetical protein